MRGEALSLPLFAPRQVAQQRRELWQALGQQVGNRDPDGLRSYQREAVTRIREYLAINRSTLLVMSTGTGKTQVFSAIAKALPRPGPGARPTSRSSTGRTSGASS